MADWKGRWRNNGKTKAVRGKLKLGLPPHAPRIQTVRRRTEGWFLLKAVYAPQAQFAQRGEVSVKEVGCNRRAILWRTLGVDVDRQGFRKGERGETAAS